MIILYFIHFNFNLVQRALILEDYAPAEDYAH